MSDALIRNRFLLHICIPLFLGAIVYVMCSTGSHISNFVQNYVTIPRVSLESIPGWLSRFIRFYLADIAWAYALTFAIGSAFWKDRGGMIVVAVICITFEILVEHFQKVNVIPGTYDLRDIELEVLASVVAITIMIKQRRMYHEKGNETD